MHQQKGFTFWGFVFTVVPLIVVALLVMLLFPAYAEFFAVKKAVNRLGGNPAISSMTDGDVRAAFEKSLDIDEIHSIKSADLQIVRGSDAKVKLSVDYEVVVPLVSNISALMAFSASNDKSAAVVE